MNFDSTHSITGTESFLDKKLFEIGIPLLHIISGRNGMDVRYFEFSADADIVFAGL